MVEGSDLRVRQLPPDQRDALLAEIRQHKPKLVAELTPPDWLLADPVAVELMRAGATPAEAFDASERSAIDGEPRRLGAP